MFGNLDIGHRFLKVLILAKNFIYLDFCQHFGKLSRFWSKFLNISTLGKISDNLNFWSTFSGESLFWSKFPRNLFFFVKIFENLAFGQFFS